MWNNRSALKNGWSAQKNTWFQAKFVEIRLSDKIDAVFTELNRAKLGLQKALTPSLSISLSLSLSVCLSLFLFLSLSLSLSPPLLLYPCCFSLSQFSKSQSLNATPMLLRMSKATALEASAKPRPRVLQLAVQLGLQHRVETELSSVLTSACPGVSCRRPSVPRGWSLKTRLLYHHFE